MIKRSVIQFHADEPGEQDFGPAWVGSIMSFNLETGAIAHAVVLVGADTESRSRDKALNMALRSWPLKDKWSDHHAVVMNLESAFRDEDWLRPTPSQ